MTRLLLVPSASRGHCFQEGKKNNSGLTANLVQSNTVGNQATSKAALRSVKSYLKISRKASAIFGSPGDAA